MYLALAIIVLALHLSFILWVVLGVFFTRGRPVLRRLHIVSLVWGLLIEIFPWTCPLTFTETWLEQRAGATPYQGGFLLHYLDALVYPNVPPLVLVVAAAARWRLISQSIGDDGSARCGLTNPASGSARMLSPIK